MKTIKHCTVQGCEGTVLARGYCTGHYQRWRTGGNVTTPIRKTQSRNGTCRVEGCERRISAAGCCPSHYWRLREKGATGGPIPVRPKICVVDGCTRKPCGGGLCRMHYERKRKGRAVGTSTPQRRPAGEGHLSAGGYTLKTFNGKSRLEHRHIMEQLLGRALERHETVHHLNGQRSDNQTDGPLVNFRSGNLELWSTWQPAGQRVVDKVAYALAVLREYAPECLSP